MLSVLRKTTLDIIRKIAKGIARIFFVGRPKIENGPTNAMSVHERDTWSGIASTQLIAGRAREKRKVEFHLKRLRIFWGVRSFCVFGADARSAAGGILLSI